MATVTNLAGADIISTADSMATINTNFTNLNSDKIETSYIDTDTTLAADSDSKIATQKATKAFVEATASPTGKSWNEYAVATSGSDAYAIAPAGVTAYVAGQTFKFKADIANTGACTLNVNSLGAKSIKKNVSVAIETGDILLNQVVTVVYDGTNMQIVNIAFDVSVDPITVMDNTNITTSDTSEVTLLSYEIPANTLSTDKLVRFEIPLEEIKIGNSSQGVTLRLKYGSTTVATIVSSDSSARTYSGWIRGAIKASGATNTQDGQIEVFAGSATSALALVSSGHGTATEDSTGALNIIVTSQAITTGTNRVKTTGYTITSNF